MLKHTLSILLLIFWQALSAQKFSGFYIEPGYGTKINTIKKSNLPPDLVTPYFTIKAKQFLGPNSGFVSINFGYVFKNSDKVQLGFSQDEIIQRYETYGISVMTFTPTSLYGQTLHSGYGGVSCTNYSLVYKRSVLNITSTWLNPGRFIRVHINAGIVYVYKPNNGIETLTGPSGISFTAPDSSRVHIEATQYNVPMPFKRSFKINLGMDFTFGKKDREWCNFNVSFITNRSPRQAYFGYTAIQTEVKHKNKSEFYSFLIDGTGNGIYFTLSKRIYPIKMYQRRQDRKIEKYNQMKG